MRLLLIRLEGEGRVRGHFRGTRIQFQLIGERQRRADTDYVSFRRIDVRVRLPADGRLELDRVAGGSELSAAFLRQNTGLLLDELTPGLEAGLSRQFHRIVNEIFADVSFGELFPDA